MEKPAPGATLDWGVGHYERAELLRPAAEALVELAAVRPGDDRRSCHHGAQRFGAGPIYAASEGVRRISVPSGR